MVKQLQAIGVNVDNGVENKQSENQGAIMVNGATSSTLMEQVVTSTSLVKHHSFESIADETLQVLVESPVNTNSKEDGKMEISPAKLSSENFRLFVGNIPLSLTEEGLANMFNTVGKCIDVKKCLPKEGSNNTIGFVSYKSLKEAEAATRKYNGFAFGGDARLRVKLAHGTVTSHEETHRGCEKDGFNRMEKSWDTPSNTASPINKENESSGIPEYRDDRCNTKPVLENTPLCGVQNPAESVKEYRSLSESVYQESQDKEVMKTREPLSELYNEGNKDDQASCKKAAVLIPENQENTSPSKPVIEKRKTEERMSYVPLTTIEKMKAQIPKLKIETEILKKPVISKTDRIPPRLYVQGIKVGTTVWELRELFQQIGPVCYEAITPPRKPNQYTTFGFFSYLNLDHCHAAIDRFSGCVFKGTTLNVEFTDDTKRLYGMMAEDEDEALFYDRLYDDDLIYPGGV